MYTSDSLHLERGLSMYQKTHQRDIGPAILQRGRQKKRVNEVSVTKNI